ncbi:MAG: SOS response-associated peptidase [Janthinobacterium lividum]
MCGRFRNLQTWSDLYGDLQRFLGPVTQAAVNLEPREQVRPTQTAPIVRMTDGAVGVASARWWLVPWFYKGTLKGWKATTFNARAETVATSRAYRDSFKRRRCLVPADGWYEWMGPHDEDDKRKQPWLFAPRDRAPIMLAGIWDRCETSDQGLIESFSVVTQPAGAPLNGYHDRAPIVLFGDEWARWLDPNADVAGLLGPESRDRFDVVKCAIR